MLGKNFSSVTERDVDFCLMEELHINDEFGKWFSNLVGVAADYRKKIGAWHSVCDSAYGESDLIFLFKSLDNRTKAILIENKIDALSQWKQADRYQIRGERGIKEGDWADFKSCMVAPIRYLASSSEAGLYNSIISYEQILEYFQTCVEENERFGFKAMLMQEAIDQNRRGYQSIVNEEMTEFVSQYIQYVESHFPNFSVEAAKPRPADSHWVRHTPNELPDASYIQHQIKHGAVKLFLGKRAVDIEAIKEKCEASENTNLKIEVTKGGSVALVIKVQPVNPLETSFQDELPKLKHAFGAINDMREICKQFLSDI